MVLKYWGARGDFHFANVSAGFSTIEGRARETRVAAYWNQVTRFTGA
jgi:hypothetical protein